MDAEFTKVLLLFDPCELCIPQIRLWVVVWAIRFKKIFKTIDIKAT